LRYAYFVVFALNDATSIKKPADWDAIVSFANHPRTTFEEVRNNRPPKQQVEKALSAYLEQIRFRNCGINEGYLKALGLK
jgi:endoglucanase